MFSYVGVFFSFERALLHVLWGLTRAGTRIGHPYKGRVFVVSGVVVFLSATRLVYCVFERVLILVAGQLRGCVVSALG